MGLDQQQSFRVLVVEDSPSDAALICAALEDAGDGWTTQRVEVLAAARRVLDRDRFDCAVVDLGLPDAAGLEVVEHLQLADPDLPVVVVTGADESLGAEAVRRGAQDFISKGEISSRRLRDAVTFATQRAQARRRRDQATRTALAPLLDHLADVVARARTADPARMHDALQEIAGVVGQCAQALAADGARPTTSRIVPLEAVTNRALTLLAPEAAEAGATTTVGPLPVVAADGDSMLEVMLHLLRGAMRSGPSPVHVWVHASVSDGWATVTVGADAPDGAIRDRLRSLQGLQGYGPLGAATSMEFCSAVLTSNGGSLWSTADERGHRVVRFRLPTVG